MRREALSEYLNDLLKVGEFSDYCPNGLQVEGREEINRIVTAVSASAELFREAAARKADAVIVHHGILWKGDPEPLRGGRRERVRLLLLNDMNLFAYHLPLDAHEKFGNNAQLARLLGLKETRPFGLYEGRAIGVRGEVEATPARAFFYHVEKATGRRPIVFPFGREEIRTVGIVSGGAHREVAQAVAEKLDAYVTGEAAEPTLHYAKEEGIHFVAAGHYATEKFGVKALGEHLEEKFGLKVEFVDLPNPV